VSSVKQKRTHTGNSFSFGNKRNTKEVKAVTLFHLNGTGTDQAERSDGKLHRPGQNSELFTTLLQL
jgi:hypothetical protein